MLCKTLFSRSKRLFTMSVRVNAAMTLVIMLSLKTTESLQNWVATHSGATPFFLIRALSLASLQRWRCRSVKTGLKKNISSRLCALPAVWCDEIFQWLVVLVLPHGVPWSVGDASASQVICVSPGIKQILWIRGCTIYKSWLYNMLNTFPDWNISRTFPVFLMFWFLETENLIKFSN